VHAKARPFVISCIRYSLFPLLCCTLFFPLSAQNTVGRWALSTHGIANCWFNDYNQRIVGLGGDFQVRYGVSRAFSVGGEFALNRLKTAQDPIRADVPNPYLKLNTRSFSILGWTHILPGKPASPYVFGGVGILWFSRSTHIGYYPDARAKSSICIPLGIGVETFSTRSFSFDFNLSYAVMSDHTDALRKGFADGALVVKFGIYLYIGSSDDDDDDGDGLSNAEEERFGTNSTNPDTDEDGLGDGVEVRRFFTDPIHADTDGDRLKDGDEVLRYFSDPLKIDSDGDGTNDGDEVYGGTDPLNPAKHL
jgi:opacity protein-like surface antigen